MSGDVNSSIVSFYLLVIFPLIIDTISLNPTFFIVPWCWWYLLLFCYALKKTVVWKNLEHSKEHTAITWGGSYWCSTWNVVSWKEVFPGGLMDMVWNQHPSPALSKAHNLFLPWNLYLDLGEDNPYILSALEDDNLNGAACLLKTLQILKYIN